MNQQLFVQEMLDEMQCEVKEYDWPDLWYFGKERQFLQASEKASVSAHAFNDAPDAEFSGEHHMQCQEDSSHVRHKQELISFAACATSATLVSHQKREAFKSIENR